MAGDLLVSLEQQSVELGRLALSRAHKPEPAVSTLLLLKADKVHLCRSRSRKRMSYYEDGRHRTGLHRDRPSDPNRTGTAPGQTKYTCAGAAAGRGCHTMKMGGIGPVCTGPPIGPEQDRDRPWVVSDFHRSQEIVLPTFCHNPANSEERRFNTLDVRRIVLQYLDQTRAFRIDHNLFVHPSGQNKGQRDNLHMPSWKVPRNRINAPFQQCGHCVRTPEVCALRLAQFFQRYVIPPKARELKKLKQQKFDLETRIRAEELSTDDIAPEHLTIEKLTEIIEKLKNEIKKEKVAHHNNSLLLRRQVLQIYNAIRNKLSEKTPESQMIYETMKHTRGLCDQIQALKKESRMLAEQMIDIRHQRMQLKETCTTLMAELRVMKEEQNNDLAQLDNPEFKKTRDYIKKETDTVTVLQNVFQSGEEDQARGSSNHPNRTGLAQTYMRLILSSGVNWAEDPNLKEILLKMGEKNPPCS
ncbi:unnamed protein product [Ranitomeya imitator]|uniref:Centromere protein H C-terminal domain-containing protein n=1 Tax=Ranitomeya imitator TaxID=111125 RepID=A0ABN9LJA6_9NEOB|nr:unnamed protein product [Ranitomeya imitator]